MLITIRNNKLYATIDDQLFAYKQSKGRLKGWVIVQAAHQVAPILPEVEEKPHFNEFSTYKDMQIWLNSHGLQYDHNCKDKRKLYNIILQS